MNIKILKTQVCANTVIGKQSVEHPVDVDFTIPDYCGEIERILKCTFIPRINSKSISGQNVVIDGHVTVRLIYCNSENKIYSFEHLVPFTKGIEIKGVDDKTKIKAEVKCSYCNCRAVTERKVDVHGAVEIKIIAKSEKKNEVLCDVDSDDVQILKGTASMLNSKGYCEKALIIDEEIEIGQGQPEIVSLIRSSGAPCITDMKIINGKVLLRGEMQICVLYCGSDNKPVIMRSGVPFSQVLDIDDANENCKCSAEVEVVYFEVKPKTTPSGQVRLLAVSTKLMVTGECFCQDDVPVILDAYSVCGEMEAKYSEVEFEKISSNYNENLICSAQNEIVGGSIGSIVDVWCEVGNVNTHFSDDALNVSGVVKAFMLLYDINGNAFFSEKPIDFNYSLGLQNLSDEVYTNPQIEVVNCTYTLTGENTVEIRVELKITGGIFEVGKMPMVTDLVRSESKEERHENTAAMVVYYADAGERIWDVARKYNSSVDEIISINELTADVLPFEKALIIPLK